MIQIDLLTKYVMEYKVVNEGGANSGASPNDVEFEAMYNEEVQFLSNQVACSRLSYARQGENQGLNRYHDDVWRDID